MRNYDISEIGNKKPLNCTGTLEPPRGQHGLPSELQQISLNGIHLGSWTGDVHLLVLPR
jgi:hypothetical protein